MSNQIYVTAEMLRDSVLPLDIALSARRPQPPEIDTIGLDEHDARMLRSAHALRDDCDARGYDEIAEFVIGAIESRRTKT